MGSMGADAADRQRFIPVWWFTEIYHKTLDAKNQKQRTSLGINISFGK